MRGEFILNLLRSIGNFSGTASAHRSQFFSSEYGSKLSKKIGEDERNRLQHRYYAMMHKLETDELIEKPRKNGKKSLLITLKGRNKQRDLEKEIGQRLHLPEYPKMIGSTVIIVSFDIPEGERRKRAWLRSVLKNLGLQMVHQSTWIGRGKLPKNFLDDLYKLRLVDYIEIFEVTKAGTLSHVI